MLRVTSLGKFNPLFYINYSATHRENFNMVYRLDAVDAYQKQLVKKITVKGISVNGTTATNGYLYLQRINVYPQIKAHQLPFYSNIMPLLDQELLKN
jgi:type III restriction enzyme